MACAQGMQVMIYSTHELLRDDLLHNGFVTKEEKSEVDSKRR